MIAKTYNPNEFESKITKLWEEINAFAPKKGDKGTHIHILPPPNANGELHLGHASGYVIMDIAGRFARMQGKETLLLPGKDHAGILTQTVFEKILLKQGIKRQDLGREEFYKQSYKFCIDSSSTMREQEKRIGISADWIREKFTLDPTISEETLKTFVKMYEDGLAYKDNRIINWCPNCQTALSDMEVEHKDHEGFIWELRYPIKNERQEKKDKGKGVNIKGQAKVNENDFIVVATTRPETMLGDTAVAVNPKDKRYKKLIGKTILLPIVNREIPIIADKDVDMEFGSGAVKVTPAHDPLDYKIGKRNKLSAISVIGMDGKMTKEAGKEFQGLSTEEARKLVIQKFTESGLLESEKKYTKPLSCHDRCGKIIEPIISDQWWINVDHPKFSLKKEAIKVIKTGKIKIVPKHFEKTYYNWMENLEDWCVSRQIWWSHQIPAWYCKDCNHINVTLGEKTEIFYMRHGETDLNNQNIFQGFREDVSLNSKGIQQAKDQASIIEKINPDIIICSPLKRAKETAEIVTKKLGKKLIVDDRLVERNFGDFSSKKIIDVQNELGIKSRFEMRKYHFKDYPGGESYKNVCNRLKNFFDEIENKYKGKKVLLIAHGGLQYVLRVIEKGMTQDAAITYPRENANIEIFTRYTQYKTCPKCGSKKIYQDQDTFDTWFSSGQWAHNTVLPFPGDAKYFPGDFMVMGRDILFFWACRMIMMSLYSTGKAPFKTLYLTGLILDKYGKKMSKSKGNGINPLEMCDKYGTDALRLSLFIGNAPGSDMRLWEEKIENYRNFVNKLWNASRFVQMQLENKNIEEKINIKTLSEADKWILTSLQRQVHEITNDIEDYQYSNAGQKLYDFTWNEFCDWYLELSKGEKQNTGVLIYVLQTLLKLLHPFIPFVTEVIYKELFENKIPVALMEWPTTDKKLIFKDSLKNINDLINTVKSIRALKLTLGIEPGKKVKVKIKTSIKTIKNSEEEINKLAKAECEIGSNITKSKDDAFNVVSSEIEVIISKEGNIDKEKQIKKQEKEIEELKKQIANLEGRLSNKSYLDKAPSHLVEETKKELKEAKEKLGKIKM